MIGHRRAAVALHALDGKDRRWVLAALPVQDKAVLTEYLDELNALGFEQDGMMSERLLAEPAHDAASATSVDRIRRASVSQMHAILEAEPAALIAQVITLEDWPWKMSLMKSFSAVRQEAIHAARFHTVPPARRQFLLDAIDKQLAAQVERISGRGDTANDSVSFASNFKRWIMRWKR